MSNSDYRATLSTTIRDFVTFLGSSAGVTEKRYPIGHAIDDELRAVAATFWNGDGGSIVAASDPNGYLEMEVVQALGGGEETVVARLSRIQELELDQTVQFDIVAGRLEYLKPLYLVVKGNFGPSSSPTYSTVWSALDSVVVTLAFDGQNPKMQTGQGY